MASGNRCEAEAAAARPDWLEAARQAFLWRYFYDDCGRSDQGNSDSVLRGRSYPQQAASCGPAEPLAPDEPQHDCLTVCSSHRSRGLQLAGRGAR